MKKTISIIWPFLLLFLSIGFMTQNKHLNYLSAVEKNDIQFYVHKAEASSKQDKKSNNDKSNNGDEDNDNDEDDEESKDKKKNTPKKHEKEDKTSYAITSDDQSVTVHKDDGTPVFHTSRSDWENHRDSYYAKYSLG